MPRGGAGGQNLGHPLNLFLSVMKTTQADSWADFGQACDIDLRIMK